jgi:hypothetical protein
MMLNVWDFMLRPLTLPIAAGLCMDWSHTGSDMDHLLAYVNAAALIAIAATPRGWPSHKTARLFVNVVSFVFFGSTISTILLFDLKDATDTSASVVTTRLIIMLLFGAIALNARNELPSAQEP